MIKVAILDDHELFLQGTQNILNEEEDISIIKTFASGESLLAEIEKLEVDILLLDVQLPDISAEDLLKAIRQKQPETPILYLTMLRGSRIIRRLEKQHIQGYILKDVGVDELVKAIKQVASGGTYFSPDILYSTKNQQTNTVTNHKVSQLLSPRELEILKLICQEMSNAEIAKKLFLSVGTVDTHRKNIIVKLGVNNTVGMVKFAIMNGILEA